MDILQISHLILFAFVFLHHLFMLHYGWIYSLVLRIIIPVAVFIPAAIPIAVIIAVSALVIAANPVAVIIPAEKREPDLRLIGLLQSGRTVAKYPKIIVTS